MTPSNSFLAALVLLVLFALKSLTVVIYAPLLYAASGLIFPLHAAIAINLLETIIMNSIPYKAEGLPTRVWKNAWPKNTRTGPPYGSFAPAALFSLSG